MLLFILSIAALALAPLIFRLAGRRDDLLAAVDGFTFTSVFGLVALVIIPSGVSDAGWVALLLALLGFLGPTLIERSLAHAAGPTHATTLALALAGLLAHAFIDGVALQEHGHDRTQQMLAVAVVLHRLPVGLAIWWLLTPTHGRGWATALLVGIAAATAGGFFSGHLVSSTAGLSLFQAFVGGSLLHVLAHRQHPASAPPRVGGWRLFNGLGGALGVALVVGLLTLGEAHDHGAAPGHGATIAHAFLALAIASAPALLLGYLGAGLLHGLMPAASTAWLGRGGPLSSAARGVLFGLPLPVCSCGVIPLYRGLVDRGAPATSAMAFLVATPEIGVDAVLLSAALLGGPLTVSRVLAAAVVALVVGWLVGRGVTTRNLPLAAPPEAAPLSRRLSRGLRAGFTEVVDSTIPWILLGLGIAAAITPLLDLRVLGALPPGVDVPLFALIGMPAYICASGATPLVAALVHKGASPGAALALLLTGPATNATTFGVLSAAHGRRHALRFAALVALLAVACGYLANVALGAIIVPAPSGIEHEESILRWVALGGLGLLALCALLRQGPRWFFAQIMTQASAGGPHHDECDEACPTCRGDEHLCGCGHTHEPAHATDHECCGHAHATPAAAAPCGCHDDDRTPR